MHIDESETKNIEGSMKNIYTCKHAINKLNM